MKIAILTFHFAHNYGAMLQVYALKRFIENLGFDVAIVDYASISMMRWYRPRLRSYLRPSILLREIRRYGQYGLFERFYREELGCKKTTTDCEKAIADLQPDMLVIGSDQVWNDSITNCDESYFKTLKGGKTLTYAASFGKSELTEWQSAKVKKYLNDFYRVSVREPEGAQAIEALMPLKVSTLLDSVFLLPLEVWKQLENPVTIKSEPYILFYSLGNDSELIEKTKALANEKGLPVYAVDIFCEKRNIGIVLRNIGPKEFLSLVHNAQYVCANSFHAVAFSVLMGKKLLHVPKSTKETRAVSLLERIGARACRTDIDGIGSIYDFSQLDRTKLEAEIKKAQVWLTEALR